MSDSLLNKQSSTTASSITFRESFVLSAENESQQSARSALLLHGLTGSPSEMEPLANALHREGYSVVVPRLSGHGKSIESLRQTKVREWFDDARVAFEKTKQFSTRPFVVGQSFGGLLALALAVKNSAEISALAALSVPFSFQSDVRHWALEGLSFLPGGVLDKLAVVKKTSRPKDYLAFPHNAFREHSIGAGARLMKVRRYVSTHARRIQCPVLLLQDPFDHHLDFDASLLLAEKLTNSDLCIELFAGAEHEMLIGHQHQKIAGAIQDFFKRQPA